MVFLQGLCVSSCLWISALSSCPDFMRHSKVRESLSYPTYFGPGIYHSNRETQPGSKCFICKPNPQKTAIFFSRMERGEMGIQVIYRLMLNVCMYTYIYVCAHVCVYVHTHMFVWRWEKSLGSLPLGASHLLWRKGFSLTESLECTANDLFPPCLRSRYGQDDVCMPPRWLFMWVPG